MRKNKTGIKVFDAMTKDPVMVRSGDLLPKCARKMLSNNVGALIVTDGGKLAGIATEKDFVEKAIGKELNIKKTKIKDIMTTGMMITISPDVDLIDAIELMIREDVRRLPVIKDKKLVGLLTIKDILKIQPDLIEACRPIFKKK